MKIETVDFPAPGAGRRAAEIPDRGITVVTGPNGVGKSTLFVEAMSWALFGRTLRGITVDTPCEVRFEVGDLVSHAKRGAASTKLRLAVRGEKSSPETATKGWARLSSLLGLDFDLWHRTHVFSIEKVAKFSTAKDTERKALLEAMLGIERYEKARRVALDERRLKGVEFDASRAEVHRCRMVADAATADVERLEARIATLSATSANTAKALEERVRSLTVYAQGLGGDLDAARAETPALEAVRAEASELYGRGVAKSAALDQQLRRATSSKEKAISDSVCSSCGRPFDGDHDTTHLDREIEEVGRMALSARAALMDLHRAKAAAEDAVKANNQRVRALEDKQRAVAKDLEAARAELQAAREVEGRIREVEASLIAAEAREESSRVTLAEAEAAVTANGRALDVLAATVNVLGPRGVRARLLDAGVKVVEDGANSHLTAMGTGARVQIVSSRTKSDGTLEDVIDVTVEPWGGGKGYGATSGGERKRLDVALMLGAAGLYTPPPLIPGGLPLVFDDVFDTLDPSGITAMIKLLTSIAVDRSVIVITQSTTLADRLPAAARFDIER